MYKSTLSLIVLSLLLVACGDKKPVTLEGKRALLSQKKSELMAINQEIANLEAEIAELDPQAKARSRQTPVSVQDISQRTFKHFVEVQGTVAANKNVLVSPKTPGVITQLHVRKGQSVRSGQLLAQLDDAIMRSSIEEVKTQLELAGIMFEKQKNLWEQEIGTEVQFLTAKNQKEALERRLATLEEQLKLNRITAPISGTIDEILPKAGETVAPGMPAFRIVNNSDLSLVAMMSESYVPFIRKGDMVNVHFPTLDKKMEARVDVVGSSIDPLARTFKVEIGLPNDPILKANMFGEISINDRTREDAIIIPQVIIQKSELGDFVFVAESEGEKWVAKRKSIQTDLSYDGSIEVSTGLKQGDKLIVSGYKGLSDGQEIVFGESIATN